MNIRWMTIMAGVFDILGGIAGVGLGSVFLLAATGFFPFPAGQPRDIILGSLLTAAGVIAIAGGICTFRKKAWPFALSGAIAGLLCSIPWLWVYWGELDSRIAFSEFIFWNLTAVPGIAAIILTVKSRKQFG